MDILTTVCEAGGIVGVIGLVLALLIKMMKRNGCTLRCFHCNGKPFIELDCEQGSAQNGTCLVGRRKAHPVIVALS